MSGAGPGATRAVLERAFWVRFRARALVLCATDRLVVAGVLPDGRWFDFRIYGGFAALSVTRPGRAPFSDPVRVHSTPCRSGLGSLADQDEVLRIIGLLLERLTRGFQ